MITDRAAARSVGLACLLISISHQGLGHRVEALVTLYCALAALALALFLPREKGRPAMSKPNKRRFRLQQIRQVQADKRGSVIEIETEDGQVFSLPAPGFWPDEASELMLKRDEVALARVLIGGPEEYAKFRTAGGQASDVALAIAAFADEQGVTPGESGASSDS